MFTSYARASDSCRSEWQRRGVSHARTVNIRRGSTLEVDGFLMCPKRTRSENPLSTAFRVRATADISAGRQASRDRLFARRGCKKYRLALLCRAPDLPSLADRNRPLTLHDRIEVMKANHRGTEATQRGRKDRFMVSLSNHEAVPTARSCECLHGSTSSP